MQIQIEKTLDVEVVERELAELWKQSSGDRETDDEAAVLRARVANLLVFVPDDELLEEAHQLLRDLTAVHPSRTLMMLGLRGAPDQDIEMAVDSFFQTDKRTDRKRLCCEEVTLKAQGIFVEELPSAALPLLVSDLTSFLWWRDQVQVADKVFDTLLRATDRLVIDSAEFADPKNDLLETDRLFDQDCCENVGISDINWARLTFWRELLADFYDVPTYQPWLDKTDYVGIDYVGPERESTSVAPQALLIAGWLASRLGWSLINEAPPAKNDQTLIFKFLSQGVKRKITVELNRVEGGSGIQGKLVRVELRTNVDKPASFRVARSTDNLHLLTEAKLGQRVHRGRVLPVRNRSAAQLLSREMEILCNDNIYQQALAVGTTLIELLKSSHPDHS